MRANILTDFGGKNVVKRAIIFTLAYKGGVNAAVLSRLIGIPKKILLPMLRELVDEGMLEYNNIVWRVKE